MFYNNISSVSFSAKNTYQQKLKDIVDEEKLDEFLNEKIKEEKTNSSDGKIYRYRDYLTKSEKKRFKKELVGSLGHYIINNNLHIIKKGKFPDSFIDIRKQIDKSTYKE